MGTAASFPAKTEAGGSEAAATVTREQLHEMLDREFDNLSKDGKPVLRAKLAGALKQLSAEMEAAADPLSVGALLQAGRKGEVALALAAECALASTKAIYASKETEERLPKMELGELKKMLATLKPLARDAYKAAMAAREGKDAAAARKVVRALFEHIPRGAILDAYAKATKPE